LRAVEAGSSCPSRLATAGCQPVLTDEEFVRRERALLARHRIGSSAALAWVGPVHRNDRAQGAFGFLCIQRPAGRLRDLSRPRPSALACFWRAKAISAGLRKKLADVDLAGFISDQNL